MPTVTPSMLPQGHHTNTRGLSTKILTAEDNPAMHSLICPN